MVIHRAENVGSGGAQGSAAASVPPIPGTSVRAAHLDAMSLLTRALNDPNDDYWIGFDQCSITQTSRPQSTGGLVVRDYQAVE